MNMKVGKTSSTGSVSSTRKSSKAQSVDSDFSSFLEGTESSSAAAVGGPSSVSGIESLLAAQSVGDALQDSGKKRKAAAHANDILDKLEDLRVAILTGAIPKHKLIELAQTLRERREMGLDEELNQILDEIELRAEVELAKLAGNV